MTAAHRFRRFIAGSIALMATIALTAMMTPTTAQATSTTGSISGTITDSHGPVSNAWVYVYQDVTNNYAVTATDSAGSYTLSGLQNGNYRVSVYEPSGHLSVWYGGPDYASATLVTVAGDDTSNIDFTLTRLGLVSGKITLPNGSPAANATVTLWNLSLGSGTPIATDTGGNFSLATGPGTFTLSAEVADAYPMSYYTSSGSSTQQTQAASFAVAEDAHVFHDIALHPGTHFTGTVTTDGVATSDVTVLVRYLVNDQWLSAGQGYTDAQGHYSLMAGPGDYWLTFSHIASGRYRYQAITVGTDAASQTVDMEMLKPFDTAPTPTISGQATVGSILTATPGTWSPTPDTISYQWLRNGAKIANATAATYTVTTADVGAQLAVTTTATKADYLPAEQRSAATATVPAATPQTFTRGTPTISGTVLVGKTLMAKTGAWTPTPTTFTYQWLRNNVAIRGATAATYVVAAADASAKLKVTVTGKKTGFTTASATSASTVTVPALKTIHGTTPKIVGTTKVGKKLTIRRGTWSPTGLTFHYQWYRNGKAIKGATTSSYKATKSDKGKHLSVTVRAKRTAYKTLSLTSKRTAKVR